MINRRTSRAWARIGWLASTLALAVALVFSSWSNYRGALLTESTVTRGQSGLLEAALRAVAPQENDARAIQAALDSFVAANREMGVRYVALLNPDSTVVATAGKPIAPPRMPPADSARRPASFTETVGDRVRMYFVRPPPRDFEISRRMQPSLSQDRRPRVFHYALVEFEPVMARGLVSRAQSSFYLAFIAAGILTFAALVFWRTSERYEAAMLRLEEQRRLTQLGEMSAVLAHEIRNPLASLKGNAQLLSERLEPGTKERARSDRVISEAIRLEALTSDLLDFARTGPIELEAVDPVALLQSAIEDVAPGGFAVDSNDAPVTWPMDAIRVRHALANLLQNARQAAPDGPDPQVRVARTGDALVFDVRDFGPGLPAGAVDRIFDPFFTTRTSGTGLGLALARRVAELHGGSVTAQNHPEGGALFRVELPMRTG